MSQNVLISNWARRYVYFDDIKVIIFAIFQQIILYMDTHIIYSREAIKIRIFMSSFLYLGRRLETNIFNKSFSAGLDTISVDFTLHLFK